MNIGLQRSTDLSMNALPKSRHCDIARLPLCKKVFGWLILLYVLGFYLPVIINGTGFYDDNPLLKNFLPGLIATSCVALPLIGLVFAFMLGKAFTGSARWFVLPLYWLITIVPVFGIIGFVLLYQGAAGMVGVPVGAPPRKPDIRLCTCGKAMLLTSVRQWSQRGTAIGFEGFYKCQKCGQETVIPSTYWQMQQLVGCVGCALIAASGVLVFSQKGIENPFCRAGSRGHWVPGGLYGLAIDSRDSELPALSGGKMHFRAAG